MISIVIPVYNSEKNIFNLVNNIIKIFKEFNFEIILVNDNSQDSSHEVCTKVSEEHSSVISYLKLSKNVGEHNAVMAGLKFAEGDWILIMDDDFQTTPEEGLKLVKYAINNNYLVVYGSYKSKKHNIFRNLGSKINDLTANLILRKPKNLYLNSFKCINHKLVKEIIKYEGPYSYVDGLILANTTNVGILEIEHSERKEGKSQYSFFKLLKLYLNIATNFSTFPIHLFSITGAIIAFLSSIYGIIIIVEKILNPDLPAGYSSLLTAIVFFSGIQLIFLGLIGEYVGKILKNVNQEPQYTIEYKKIKNAKK